MIYTPKTKAEAYREIERTFEVLYKGLRPSMEKKVSNDLRTALYILGVVRCYAETLGQPNCTAEDKQAALDGLYDNLYR